MIVNKNAKMSIIIFPNLDSIKYNNTGTKIIIYIKVIITSDVMTMSTKRSRRVPVNLKKFKTTTALWVFSYLNSANGTIGRSSKVKNKANLKRDALN